MLHGKPSIYQPRDFKRAGINLDNEPQGKPYFCIGQSKKNQRYGLFSERFGVYTLEETFRLLGGREDVAVIDVLRKTHMGCPYNQQFCYSQRGEEQLWTAYGENKPQAAGELIVSEYADLSKPLAQYQVIHVPTLEEVIAMHLQRLSGEETPITPDIAQQEYEQLLKRVQPHRENFIRGKIC